MEQVELCRAGRDFVEISPRECGIIAAALGSMLNSAVNAKSAGFSEEVDTLTRLFLSTAQDSRVEGLLLFALASDSDRKLYKAKQVRKSSNS